MITKRPKAGSYNKRIKHYSVSSYKDGLEIKETVLSTSTIQAHVKILNKHRQEFFQKEYSAIGYQFTVRDDVAIKDNDRLEWSNMEFKIHSIAPDLESNQLIIEAYSEDNYMNEAIN